MTAKLEDLADQCFDFIVIGGGTAGLTIAARLTEDTSINVAVLEAGPENLDDPLITLPGQNQKHFDNPKYDWAFRTEPQQFGNNRIHQWARGRMLGGSSAINFFAWNVPPKQDVDAWEKLGNPGWNWSNYSRYLMKAENFSPPEVENASKFGPSYKPRDHGHDGPLVTSFPESIATTNIPVQETLCNAGIEPAKNPVTGDPIGSYMTTATLDRKSGTRTYSVTASYLPNRNRSNFKVLCNALIHRLLMSPVDASFEDTTFRASGVEFEFEGKLYTVKTKQDIILSAGALKSPQILELSGIGNAEVLKSIGIETLIDLPGVGENMQEHMTCPVIFELKSDFDMGSSGQPDNAEHSALQPSLHTLGKDRHRVAGPGCFAFAPLTSITSTIEEAHTLITRQRKRIEDIIKSGTLPPGLKEQYVLQIAEFGNGKGGDCEILVSTTGGPVPDPSKNYVTIRAAVNHKFSRGFVHAKSNNPHEQPRIDPRYFEDDFDLQTFVEVVKFIRRLPQLEPFKGIVAQEVTPGPQCTSEEELRNFVKDNANTTFHSAGTLSMLPRAYNGVVDPELLVYGTENVRVVDLSIVPLHFAAHAQATVYAIAEQAADIVKSKQLKTGT